MHITFIVRITTSGNSSTVSFVNNGDCVDGPSFDVEGHTEVNGDQSVSYAIRTEIAEVTTNNSPVSLD